MPFRKANDLKRSHDYSNSFLCKEKKPTGGGHFNDWLYPRLGTPIEPLRKPKSPRLSTF